MTATTPEPLEVLPCPDGAIELPPGQGASGLRGLAVAALQQVLAQRRLALPLGPQTALLEEGRLLSLNQFAVQLSTAGIAADRLAVDLRGWQDAAAAPQLLLAAQVDEENDVVVFPGVLTAEEFVALADGAGDSELVELESGEFKGGLERLLTLVQLLEPDALPRLALGSVMAPAAVVVAVADWLRGQLDAAIGGLGAQLVPVTAGAFRSGAPAAASADEALAMVVIPLGLSGEELVSGEAASRCVRRFQLALIATGEGQPSGLLLRLNGAVPGALLPDGLELCARQGSHEQRIRSADSTELDVSFRAAAGELLQVSLRYGDGPAVELPALRLPAA